MTSSSSSHHQPSGGGRANIPLRRAKYVTVLELVSSQYNIDRTRLDHELSKLKKAAAAAATAGDISEDAAAAAGGGDDDRDANVVGDDAPVAGSNITKKPNAWATTNLSLLPGGPLGNTTTTPTLPSTTTGGAGHHHQSRLQPPRDGFNLCL